MNPFHMLKVQGALERMTPYQRAFVAKFGDGTALSGAALESHSAEFSVAMVEAGRRVWEEELAGVELPLDLSGGVDYSAGFFAGIGEGFFKNANLRGAILDRSRWLASEAKYADFSEASLKNIYTTVFMCEGSSFRGADLSGATLHLLVQDPPVDFTGANLAGAQFKIPYPTPMILTGANLEGVQVFAGPMTIGTMKDDRNDEGPLGSRNPRYADDRNDEGPLGSRNPRYATAPPNAQPPRTHSTDDSLP